MTPGKTTVVLAILAIAAGTGFWTLRHIRGENPSPSDQNAEAVPVTVATVGRQDIPVSLNGLGTVQAFNTVTIRTQVDGQIQKIAFTEGQDVQSGALLAQIDPRTYQAALDQALAKKAQDEALLATAQRDSQRYASLVGRQYVTQQQYDTTRNLVAQYQAAVKGDAASVESARVSLGYTAIRAPIDGRAGIRLVDVGNIVHTSDSTGIVTLTQLHPISVIFTLPQDVLPQVLRAMAGGPLEVAALSRDNTQDLDHGRLALVDNTIDTTTGMVKLKATMPNTATLLWPGQFVNASVRIGVRHDAVTVPTQAIQHSQQGLYVYRVKPDQSVEAVPVTATLTSGTLSVIDAGLEPGQTVVVSGQYRLQPGARIEARPTAPAAPAPAPAPEKKP